MNTYKTVKDGEDADGGEGFRSEPQSILNRTTENEYSDIRIDWTEVICYCARSLAAHGTCIRPS